MANHSLILRCKNCNKEFWLGKNMRTDYSGFYTPFNKIGDLDKFLQEHTGDGNCGSDYTIFPIELVVLN